MSDIQSLERKLIISSLNFDVIDSQQGKPSLLIESRKFHEVYQGKMLQRSDREELY